MKRQPLQLLYRSDLTSSILLKVSPYNGSSSESFNGLIMFSISLGSSPLTTLRIRSISPVEEMKDKRAIYFKIKKPNKSQK